MRTSQMKRGNAILSRSFLKKLGDIINGGLKCEYYELFGTVKDQKLVTNPDISMARDPQQQRNPQNLINQTAIAR
jgi:hypothetical protein